MPTSSAAIENLSSHLAWYEWNDTIDKANVMGWKCLTIRVAVYTTCTNVVDRQTETERQTEIVVVAHAALCHKNKTSDFITAYSHLENACPLGLSR